MAGRIRAGAACQHCHKRKLRCDGQQYGVPCSSCRRGARHDCELLMSNRGQYTRKSQGQQRQLTTSPSTQPRNTSATHDILPPSWPLESGEGGQTAAHPTSQLPQQLLPIYAEEPRLTRDPNLDRWSVPPHAAEEEPAPAPALSVEVNETWKDMFETFLASRGGENAVDKASITYLGESFPLATVLADLRQGGSLRLHHPGPARAPSQSSPASHGSGPSHLSDHHMAFLARQGVFQMSHPKVMERLIQAFLDQVYPLYPLVILRDFMRQIEDKTVPWILLQAVLFAGTCFCPLSTLYLNGFPSRREAQEHFYHRCKLLFDFNYEKDKVVVLQSAILMTFWPSSPSDMWTFYHWIGFAVTIAESLGLHRSMINVSMSSKDRSLLKRIWWVLVIRDSFGSALFGRPVRINGIHCDVEHPAISDFEYDNPSESSTKDLHAQYLVYMSKLAINQRDITTNRFTTGRSTDAQDLARNAASQALDDWRESLPAELDFALMTPSRNRFTATLSILHDSNLIFMAIQKPLAVGLEAGPEIDQRLSKSAASTLPNVVFEAADRITNTACAINLLGTLLDMPHEAFTGLFVAAVAQYIRTDDADSSVAQLARTKVEKCQLLFHAVKDFWDPSTWVLELFHGLLSNESVPHFAALQSGPALVNSRLGDIFLNDWEAMFGDHIGFSSTFQDPGGGNT